MGRWGLNPLEGDAGLDLHGNFEMLIYRLYYRDYKNKTFKFRKPKGEFFQLSTYEIRKTIKRHKRHIVRYLSTSEDIQSIAGFILLSDFSWFKWVEFTEKEIDAIVGNTILSLDFYADFEVTENDMKPYEYLNKNKNLLVGTWKERVIKITDSYSKNPKETNILIPTSLFERINEKHKEGDKDNE